VLAGCGGSAIEEPLPGFATEVSPTVELVSIQVLEEQQSGNGANDDLEELSRVMPLASDSNAIPTNLSGPYYTCDETTRTTHIVHNRTVGWYANMVAVWTRQNGNGTSSPKT
jgi:hypothetical protein